MRRPSRRPTYFSAHSLRDGTITVVVPMRKPAARIMKRDGMRIDPDGICKEYVSSGIEYRDCRNETRFRFQDNITSSLNTKRAIRKLILPILLEIHRDIKELDKRIQRIEQGTPGNIKS